MHSHLPDPQAVYIRSTYTSRFFICSTDIIGQVQNANQRRGAYRRTAAFPHFSSRGSAGVDRRVRVVCENYRIYLYILLIYKSAVSYSNLRINCMSPLF